jgi:mevalonate kinase
LPSGADVIAQMMGGLCEVNINPFAIDNSSWPFRDYGFVIVPTKEKLATHEHLKNLNSFDPTVLRKAYAQGVSALKTSDPIQFIEAIKSYALGLERLGFVTENTRSLCSELNKFDAISAIKGCGAMGSDVLFICFEKKRASEALSVLQSLNLSVTSTHEDLTHGLRAIFEPSLNLTRRPSL